MLSCTIEIWGSLGGLIGGLVLVGVSGGHVTLPPDVTTTASLTRTYAMNTL